MPKSKSRTAFTALWDLTGVSDDRWSRNVVTTRLRVATETCEDARKAASKSNQSKSNLGGQLIWNSTFSLARNRTSIISKRSDFSECCINLQETCIQPDAFAPSASDLDVDFRCPKTINTHKIRNHLYPKMPLK
jgi:hypothetical protein